jgi:hypothetical protein
MNTTDVANMAKSGYKYESRCKICTAHDSYGKELRPEVENLIAQGKTYLQVRMWLLDQGVKVSPNSIVLHVGRHAPYIKNLPSKASARLITTIVHQTTDARNVIDGMISKGGEMIENWWREVNGDKHVKGPKMPISQSMFMGALREESKRAPRTTVDAELDAMEQELIESELKGEEVNEQISAPKQ